MRSFHYVVPLGGWLGAAPEPAVSAFGAALVAVAAMALAFVFRAQALQLHNLRMRVALDNMSQGLCMFDGRERLVVCNRRYAEMYALPHTVARPGTMLSELLKYRAAHGSFSRKVDEYRGELLASIAGGATRSVEVKSKDGRTILVINRPMAGGGWVATHEDITERRDAERERASLHEQQERRGMIDAAIAAFRRRVEEHLRTVAEGAIAMRATATALFGNSGQTSKSAESAVSASNEACTNVETAAIAADELTGSIASRMQEIDSCATAVSSAVEEQNTATAEISQNVAGAADGAKLVVSVLCEVAGAATDTRQSAQSVLEASQAVEAAASELRREVEGVLASVAA